MMCVPECRNERNITGNSVQELLAGGGSEIWRLTSMRGGWPEESRFLHPQLRRRLFSPEDRTKNDQKHKKAGSPETFRTAG